jgi:hypothetical protein
MWRTILTFTALSLLLPAEYAVAQVLHGFLEIDIGRLGLDEGALACLAFLSVHLDEADRRAKDGEFDLALSALPPSSAGTLVVRFDAQRALSRGSPRNGLPHA